MMFPFHCDPGVAGGVFGVKVAVTAMVEFIVTTHVPVPEQPPPDQPVKV
jgi:hypothetical protein